MKKKIYISVPQNKSVLSPKSNNYKRAFKKNIY